MSYAHTLNDNDLFKVVLTLRLLNVGLARDDTRRRESARSVEVVKDLEKPSCRILSRKVAD